MSIVFLDTDRSQPTSKESRPRGHFIPDPGYENAPTGAKRAPRMKFEYLDQPAASSKAPIKFQYLDPTPTPSQVRVTAPKSPSAPWYMEPLGPLEAIANMGVNTAASVAGGLGALADAPLYASGITNTSPTDVVHAAESFAAKPIFQPETATGKALLTAASWPFKKLAQGARAAGNYVLDKTDSPAAAAAVDTAIQGIPMVAGAKLPESPLVKGTAAGRARAAAKAAQNAVANETLRQTKSAGYRLPPTKAAGGVTNSLLEGLSGAAKAASRISAKNQHVTDALVRRELELPPDTPLTPERIAQLRSDLHAAYDGLRSTGMVETSPEYHAAIDQLHQLESSAAHDFPGLAANSEIDELAQSLKQPRFSASAAVDGISLLREHASDHFRQGKTRLARAERAAAGAIEEELGRHLDATHAPQSLIDDYRRARKKIAQTYAVENALDTSTGHVNARDLARQWERGKPLTGALETIARMGARFPEASGIPKGVPVGLWDLLGGVPWFMHLSRPELIPLLGLRPGLRELVASVPYQKAMVRVPSYRPGAMSPGFAQFLQSYAPAGTASAQQQP